MSMLARVKIITKILVVIMLLAAVAVGTSWLGIHAMSSMNDDAETMNSSAKRALEAARANTSLMTLSSAEFQVALDPRPENRAIVRKVVDEQMKLFNERFEDMGKTRDEKVRSMLPAIKATIAAYEKGLENTLRLASETTDVQLTDQIERLRASAMNSQTVAAKLRAEMRAAAEQLNDRVNHFAKVASDEYHATSRQLMIVAAVGIVFGTLAGFLIGQFGIVRPINLLKAVMEGLCPQRLEGRSSGC
jgi:methyl-accepting chemotaxis protein